MELVYVPGTVSIFHKLLTTWPNCDFLMNFDKTSVIKSKSARQALLKANRQDKRY